MPNVRHEPSTHVYQRLMLSFRDQFNAHGVLPEASV